MKRIALVLGVAILASGCTLTTQQAKEIANSSLNTLCDNLSTADIAARSAIAAAHGNATSLRVESDAVAAVKGTCDSRPVANTGAALKAASAAFANIVAAETAGK